ncbi:hypothetical protein [Streptomyces sp. Je 1-369]|uniref:hypothetical protein n=1 Tax=Streptomyces sp. Je 1-369 TaxID=2966192 RepID=UPI002285FDBD|nr:hypothetical protein [Streptomyces sp. Je 1-369]WAL99549.1 hypothetical protein NOO62_36820 [Streptomyces sp. Je 1-369]
MAGQPVRAVSLHGDLRLGNVLDGDPSRGLSTRSTWGCVDDSGGRAVTAVLAVQRER